MKGEDANQMMKFTKKQITIFGIAGSVVLVILLLALFTSGSHSGTSGQQSPSQTPLSSSQRNNALTPTPLYRTSVLSFQQQTATSTAIMIDTVDKPASAVQLQIGFDPAILRNIRITPGTFFDRSLVLLSNIDYKSGSIFYAVVTSPSGMPRQGKGVVAVISYTFAQGAINPTTLQFLPETKVAAIGIDDSILKLASNISISASSQQ